jgi:hypothetical protein
VKKISKLSMAGSAVLSVLLISGLASAGAKWINEQVHLSTSGHFAYGALGYTRNTSNSVEYIYCQVYSYNSGSPRAYAYCGAKDSSSNTYSCISSDPAIVSAAGAVSGDSYVYFAGDANGNCTFVEAENASGHQLKGH